MSSRREAKPLTEEQKKKIQARAWNPTESDIQKAKATCSFVHVGVTSNGRLHLKPIHVTNVSRKLMTSAHRYDSKGNAKESDPSFTFYLDRNYPIAGSRRDVETALGGGRINEDLALDGRSFLDKNSEPYRAYLDLLDSAKQGKQGECGGVLTDWRLEDVLILAQFRGSASVVEDTQMVEEAKRRAAGAFGNRVDFNYAEQSVNYYQSGKGYVLSTVTTSKRQLASLGKDTEKHTRRTTPSFFFAEATHNTRPFWVALHRNERYKNPVRGKARQHNDEKASWNSLRAKYSIPESYDDLLAQMGEQRGSSSEDKAVPYVRHRAGVNVLSGRRGEKSGSGRRSEESGSGRSEEGASVSYVPAPAKVPSSSRSRSPSSPSPVKSKSPTQLGGADVGSVPARKGGLPPPQGTIRTSKSSSPGS